MRKQRGRKLLVASLGVAAVSYVACSRKPDVQETTGNLVAPPPEDPTTQPTGEPPPQGNADAAPDAQGSPDAQTSAKPPATTVTPVPPEPTGPMPVGNLVAPPEPPPNTAPGKKK